MPDGARVITGYRAALAVADEQIREWQSRQVSPRMAAKALDVALLDEALWEVIRRRLAVWYLAHPEAGNGC
ncbi:MAG TPA: hypothetical protein VEW06_06250 [Xanthobacteraceae bacterium]|nr:hypothetical protein [Xanthobacteraceae bacterium]